MVSKSNVHGPATFMQSTGFVLPGFPSMGAWISYGLGSLSDLRALEDRGVAAAIIGMALYSGAMDPRVVAEEFAE